MPRNETARPSAAHKPRQRRLRWRIGLAAVLLAWGGVGYWHTTKPLLPGVHVSGEWVAVPEGGVDFLRDVTTADAWSRAIHDQQIFDAALAIIAAADEFIVLDFFLFNAHRGRIETEPPHRALSAELRDALLSRMHERPALRVLFITDPINDVYGGDPSDILAELRAAGATVVVTELDGLRDSNPGYSAFRRLALGWWVGALNGASWLPNPLDIEPAEVELDAWTRLVNFKANHRKVLIADDGGGGLVGIVTSANPHDASSAHSNVALRLSGRALAPLLESELAIARFSGWPGDDALEAAALASVNTMQTTPNGGAPAPVSGIRARVLTEGAIEAALLERLRMAASGDRIDIAMFYLSDRDVLGALRAAARRGVAVRVLLDPNRDAFGRTKSGIPNRPVASELSAASDGEIRIRWYRTHGEQFHVKLVAITHGDRIWITAGSANLTRRNLDDYNLEANIAIEAPLDSAVAREVQAWFDGLWGNDAAAGIEYTADFGVYAEAGQSKYWAYRIMEATGLSTF